MERRYDYIRVINKSNRPGSHISNRIGWLDCIRGLALISMFFYHYMWDVVYLYGGDFPWYSGTLGYVWQQSICWSFILISGFSTRIGKHIARRGVLIFIGGLIITVFTCIVTPNIAIWFGILTLIGTAMIITKILNLVLIKTPTVFGLLLSALAFFLTRNVNSGYLGFYSVNLLKLPEWLYRDLFTSYLGFPAQWFASSDYFSIIPWIFLFWCGYYMYGVYEKINIGKTNNEGIHLPIVNFLGKHSLVFYIVHQPVIYLILDLIYRYK